MNVQYLKDEKQKVVGVFIPIKIWEQMKMQIQDLDLYEKSTSNNFAILNDISNSAQDVEEIEKTKI